TQRTQRRPTQRVEIWSAGLRTALDLLLCFSSRSSSKETSKAVPSPALQISTLCVGLLCVLCGSLLFLVPQGERRLALLVVAEARAPRGRYPRQAGPRPKEGEAVLRHVLLRQPDRRRQGHVARLRLQRRLAQGARAGCRRVLHQRLGHPAMLRVAHLAQ